jgi:CRP/FNR family cyclic AMP-dependent transcriptional regulator
MINAVSIFAGLDEPTLDILLAQAEESFAPSGHVIVREGEEGNRFFLIESGMVRVCKHYEEPEEIEFAVLSEGDFFGEMCILETLPRSATVQALTDATLYSVSSLAFLQVYEQQPKQYGILLLNIARDLSRRIRRLDEIFAARHG